MQCENVLEYGANCIICNGIYIDTGLGSSMVNQTNHPFGMNHPCGIDSWDQITWAQSGLVNISYYLSFIYVRCISLQMWSIHCGWSMLKYIWNDCKSRPNHSNHPIIKYLKGAYATNTNCAYFICSIRAQCAWQLRDISEKMTWVC